MSLPPSRSSGLALVLTTIVTAGCLRADIESCLLGTTVDGAGRRVCIAANDAGSDASVDTCGVVVPPRVQCQAGTCPAGETCYAFWGGPFCRRDCTTDAECASAIHPSSLCIQWEAADGTGSGLGCSIPCTPGLDQTCGQGETCSRFEDPQRGNPFFAECRPLGTGVPFTDCPPDDVTVCGANQSCDYVTDPNTATDGPNCVLQCRMGSDADCASIPGTVCRSPGIRGLECLSQYGRCILP